MEVWWQYWLWTQHFLCQWHPSPASHWSGVTIPGLWLADLCTPLMAAKNAYMGPALSRCHLQPNRNSSSARIHGIHPHQPTHAAVYTQCPSGQAGVTGAHHVLSDVTCRHINLHYAAGDIAPVLTPARYPAPACVPQLTPAHPCRRPLLSDIWYVLLFNKVSNFPVPVTFMWQHCLLAEVKMIHSP